MVSRIARRILRRPNQSSQSVPMATTPPTSGALLAPDEVADYEQLRSLISHEQSLALLDDFAKWLFASAAVVGALGTSLGVSGANQLDGTGKKVFALAVVLVAVSLALAAIARLPRRVQINRYSAEDMAANIGRLTTFRGRLLFWAAGCFVVGLILAGVAPLV